MAEYIKKDRKGTMWKENNSKVIWKGSIHHKLDPFDENEVALIIATGCNVFNACWIQDPYSGFLRVGAKIPTT